ncbi:AraC family transcriptional regulator [Sinorhizobium garamanticum]|uniref:AraC family transcriptional regulator n=1 Tax=Sinorhizobium garamanticum TaxID=680247 RepID=A0ABY8D4M4_9HYPH|nr:helix-turn-helix transcriptional regulator [Sinorhizobium garamanticum]WEX85805.1 AraC family transcriptional regulator [Sinorhizobium garamanticum]
MPERALARSVQSVVNFELQDADGLAEHIGQRFAPVRIEPIRAADRFTMSGTYGQVAGIDFSRSRVQGEFRIFPKRLYDGVFFMFPGAGSIVFQQSRENVMSSPTTAVAAEGLACRSMEFLADSSFCGVVIDRPVFAGRLSALLGHPVVEKPVFQPAFDMASGGASALRALVMCITGPEFGPQLNRMSLTAERIRETLVDLVLETWPNSYSEILRRPAPMIAPQHVKLAVDFVHEHAQMIPSGTELAALSGVSLRALQQGFRRFVGVSVGAYQRQVRLERARADLLREPGTSVEEIALRWGFTNAGRFSRYFKAAYGIFPTELIRRKT